MIGFGKSEAAEPAGSASSAKRLAVGVGRALRIAASLTTAAVRPRRTRRAPSGNRVLMLTISDVDHDPRVFKVARSLGEHGYVVDVLAPSEDGTAREYAAGEGVSYVRVPREWLWRFFVLYQDEFRRAGLEREFDFVHANDLTTLTVAWILARVRGVPLIYDAHELWTENVEPRRDGWAPMSASTRLVAGAWERYLLGSVDQIVSVSPSIVAEFGHRRRGGPEPLFLPNYPSLTLLEARDGRPSLREECGVSDDQFVTIYMGGVNPLRNIETVIRAHRHLPDEYVFAIRGPGVEAYEGDYEALAHAEGVGDRVFFLQPVGMNDVIPAAKGADCGIVMLRNICKNFYFFYPNKLFEYALAGLPIATSDFPDVRRFVLDERCGVTFDPDSPQSIAEALQRLGNDREEARAMGERGRESILQRHNWESAVEGLFTAYGRLQAPSSSGG